MAATAPAYFLITISSNNPPPQPSPLHIAMVSSFFVFLFLALFVLIFTLYKIINNYNHHSNNACKKQENPVKIQSLPLIVDETTPQKQIQEPGCGPDPENLARSLLLEILPSNSPKWDTIFSKSGDVGDDPVEKNGSGQEEKKRKKKRARKKKPDPNEEERKEKEESFVCLYPFTKSSSATQRKIKQQYDQLVKSHGSNGLTLDQIGQFVNCLVEARNELKSKSEVIKRRFTITKALLFKADRSSFDRLRQEIYKLELEQKRLEEDAFVYNWLQEQLKISPAYKKMLELGACMEMKAKSSEPVKSIDSEYSDISFEELLAQEKKDVFWQRNGRRKLCSS